MRTGATTLALLLATVAGACGSDDSGSSSPATTTGGGGGAANQVTMKLIAFGPQRLEVTAGTTVTWKQEDAGVHTVTSGTVAQGGAGVTQEADGRFNSGDLATGATFEFTFDAPGTYPYFCEIHPATMRGEIAVD